MEMTTRGSASTSREVSYSCGSCGYELNLSSSSRNTTNFGSKYGKTIKKGFISFVEIDESRFSTKEEIKCMPFFASKRSWGLCRRQTKLLCQKCGNFIGVAYEEDDESFVADESSPAHQKYKMKIRALQPLAEDGAPLTLQHGNLHNHHLNTGDSPPGPWRNLDRPSSGWR
ncbi:uncharacterized protein At4g08330, chloroplastic [Wolffia australiana]